MVIIQDKLISDDIFEVQFLCNLKACKGACCWEGEFGAPLEEEELKTLDNIYTELKPFLNPLSIKRIESEGKYTYYEDIKEHGTTLMPNGSCVYMTFDNGSAKCGIETAYQAGAVDFKKPISCHLYPLRVTVNETSGFEALNYDKWKICKAACDLGKKEELPLYQFLKEAITRKYGESFFEEMEGVGKYLGSKRSGKK